MRAFIIILLVFIPFACNSNKKVENNQAESSSELTTDTDPQTKMVLFKGGTFEMGSDNGASNEKPKHQVQVADFKLDIHPVSVEEFSAFVKATSYMTDAEKFGDAGVYNFNTQAWELKKGATWRYPLGPDSPGAEKNHPVTQVSWNDAQAYCQWAKKRLPTEVEWEYAARNSGKNKTLYSWGNEVKVDGKFKANTWQGSEITAMQGEDGFKFTSPIGYYGLNAAGLTDMGGNVWNWCEDTFTLYPGNNDDFTADPQTKCMRGGSFFFDPALEKSYTVTFRAPNTAETSLFNIGFRCAAKP